MRAKLSAIVLILTVFFAISGINYGHPYNPPPSVYITYPADGALFPKGADITIDANASDDGEITKVEFYANDTLLDEGSYNGETYEYTWNNVPAGFYALRAKAYDNGGEWTYSDPVNITVGIILVDKEATGANDGTSWEDAFNHLQDALGDANYSYEIWVAEGIYTPDSNSAEPNGTGDRAATFQLGAGAGVYGGFNGDESGRDERNWTVNETILSGDINDISNPNDNSYHVVQGADNATLDGFVVTGGFANGSDFDSNGGGMFNYQSEPNVINCIFSENFASGCGGGMFNYQSDLTVVNCVFSENCAGDYGGGIENTESSPTLTNCTFSRNYTNEYYGGGMDNDDSSPNVTNCIFWENQAGGSDDEISNKGESDPTFGYCDIKGWPGDVGDNWNWDPDYNGGGNIGSDPCFIDADNPAGPDGVFGTSDDGLRISVYSGCIDRADGNAEHFPLTDITGRARIDVPYVNNNGTGEPDYADIGAYESPTVWFVNANAIDGNDDGSSWDDAFIHLQDALAVAEDGNEIWVAEGTYKPDQNSTNPDGSGLREATFQLKAGVDIYGGFTDEMTGTQGRGWIGYNKTILSGDINDIGNLNDNSYHVVQGADNATLDGFMITGGNADGSSPDNYGAGIYCDCVSPTIRNCVIADNNALKFGSGMCNFGCNPAVTNCLFIDNTGALAWGVFNGESNPTLLNCVFAGNERGGICNSSSSPTIINCTFNGNGKESGNGGGMVNASDSCPALTNCIFWGNKGWYEEGEDLREICNFSGTPTFSYCDIRGCGGSGPNSWDPNFGADYGGNIDSDPCFADANNPAGNNGIFGTFDDGLRIMAYSPCIDAADGDVAPLTGILGFARVDINDTGIGDPNYADIGAYESYSGYGSDSDGDGLWDYEEYLLGTNPDNPDSDNDGLSDGDEFNVFRINALSADTDSDGLSDGYEVCYDGNCADYDPYDSGTQSGSDMNADSNDTDSDGMPDSWEVFYDYNSLANDANADSDNDGLTNVEEYRDAGTNPGNNDTDGDGMDDYWEYSNGLNPLDAGDLYDDPDNDGYVNILEYNFGSTDPNDDEEVPEDIILVPDDYNSIQQAINVAVNGNIIVVKPGIYTDEPNGSEQYPPTYRIDNKDITLQSINPLDPEIVATTIITSIDKVYSVVWLEDNDSNISGFTIKDGKNGIYCYGSFSSPEVTHCVISENSNFGIWIKRSSQGATPKVDNCIFSNNGDSGIYNYKAGTTVANCVFEGNKAVTGNGGGMRIECSSGITVRDCLFMGNEAISTGIGGGIYSGGYSGSIENCLFIGNKAGYKGGGLCNMDSSLELRNCIFSENIVTSSSGEGGAIYSQSSSLSASIEAYNCTFNGNNADGKGGAIYQRGKSYLTHTFTAYNCILWDNNSPSGHEIYQEDDYCDAVFNYCDIENTSGYAYGSNITTPDCIYGDPCFVCPSLAAGSDGIYYTNDDGLRLKLQSRCIDKADSNHAPSSDITGRERVDVPYANPNTDSNCADIGAYEASIIWHVKETAADANGSSWDNAMYLQDALEQAAEYGGEIWVAAGTYKPDCNSDNPYGTGDRDSSFQLVDGVGLYGGFSGNEAVRSMRDWTVHETKLSGDINGDANSYHVVSSLSNDATAIIDGFTITAGDANGSGSDSYGGGVYCWFSSPTINNCKITGNKAVTGGGAGILYKSLISSATVKNCTFSNNEADDGGGMANCHGGSPVLMNCVFNGNEADNGGGMYDSGDGSPKFINCVFSDNNTSGGNGGGMYNSDGSAEFTSCVFSGNNASGGSGGGMYDSNSSQTVTNCVFSHNQADKGGGMANCNYSTPTIKNCVFVGNEGIGVSEVDGAAMYNGNCRPTLINCTFAGNVATVTGGIYNASLLPDSSATNCILWADTGSLPEVGGPGRMTFSYCDIQGCGGSDSWDYSLGANGGGNIEVDPHFMDANNPAGPDGVYGTTDDGLRLCVLDSPIGSCLDSADNTVAPDRDITGRGRTDVPYIQNTGHGNIKYTDIGAYESPTVWYVDSSSNYSMGQGWSWDFALDDLQDAIRKACDGDEIWVAAGEYMPGSQRSDTFLLDKAIAVYGGFAGTEYNLYHRNWAANTTVLSGNIGDYDAYGDNCYHVVKVDCNDVILDGFMVTGGYANDAGNDPNQIGGGIYIDNSSPRIENCTILENFAQDGGSGMYVDSGAPTIANCIFWANKEPTDIATYGNGGGMHNKDASPIVTNCIFSGNFADYGGGMYNTNSSPIVTNCVFRENKAGGSDLCGGGGICNYGGSSLTVTNCIFNANRTNGRRAGIDNDKSSLMLNNCTFISNEAEEPDGKAVVRLDNGQGHISAVTNSIFWFNESEYQIETGDGSNFFIRYCDIEGGEEDGIYGNYEGENIVNVDPCFVEEPEFYDETIGDGWIDAIVVADAGKYSFGDIIQYGSDANARTVIYVDYNNIVIFDPPLVEASEESIEIKNWGKYAIIGHDEYDDPFKIQGKIARLEPNSSLCIDAGLDEAVPWDTIDLDDDGRTTVERIPCDIMGVPRMQNICGNPNSVDMGAFECGGLIAGDRLNVQVIEDTPETIELDIQDLKEGSPTYVIVTEPEHGTLGSGNSDVNIIYTPAENYYCDSDCDEFYYKAYDGINYSEIALVTISEISPVNDPPIAFDDEIWINEGVNEIPIDVLANDFDAEGDTLTITDPVDDGDYGETDVVSGKITYTVINSTGLAGAGYDTFDYEISDDQCRTDTATVTVKLNHRPVDVNDPNDASEPNIVTEPNIIKVIDVLANDFDEDGHSLEVNEIVDMPTQGNVQIYSHPEKGDVLLYRPAEQNPVGSYDFKYNVKDELGLVSANAATVTVDVKSTTTIEDRDSDGIANVDEGFFGTDPNNPDTDGDGEEDGDEIIASHDPTDPNKADSLPYITCFQTNQGYTPYGESLDGQKGWKVDGNDCTLDYMQIFPGSFTKPPFGCIPARLSPGARISKEFEDKGAEDDYSNIVWTKFYPINGAIVRVLAGETIIAAAKFVTNDSNYIRYWDHDVNDWANSGRSWRHWQGYPDYSKHSYGMVLKFEMDFNNHECTLLGDVGYDFQQIVVVDIDPDINSITEVEFENSSLLNEEFKVRGLYINDNNSTSCWIENPHEGDNVQESRIPVKGWCFSPYMSAYVLTWITKIKDKDYSQIFHINDDTVVNGFDTQVWEYGSDYTEETMVSCGGQLYVCTTESGSGSHSPERPDGDPYWDEFDNLNILGYWNTGALPKGIYHLELLVFDDLCYPWYDPRCRVYEGKAYWGQNFDRVDNVATSGAVRSTTFHHVEEPDISVPWPGQFPFEFRRIYDSGRCHIRYPFFPGWTNNNQIILTESAAHYESSSDPNNGKTAKGNTADSDASGLAFGAVYVQYEDSSMHLFRHTTGSIEGNEAIYVPYPDDGSGDYVKRTTSSSVPYLEVVDYELRISENNLNVNYQLYRRDGTMIEFHDVVSPDVISVPWECCESCDGCRYYGYDEDGYLKDYNTPTDDYLPYGEAVGAVWKEIKGYYDVTAYYHTTFYPPEEYWCFVTAVKTKSDRFGNTLHFEWNGNQYSPAVTEIHYYGDGIDGNTISIELMVDEEPFYDGHYSVMEGYNHAELKVGGDVKRQVDFRSGMWQDKEYEVLQVCKTNAETADEKDYTSYVYWGESGLLYEIFNDKLDDNGSFYSPPDSACSTLISYDSGREFRERVDFVDEDNYLRQYYWYYFLDPNSGNEEDGQCVLTSWDYYISDNPTLPYRMDMTTINEIGQSRDKISCIWDGLSKLTTYRYDNNSLPLPFTPTRIHEIWHDYNITDNNVIVVGRIMINEYTPQVIDFDTNNPDVNCYDFTEQSIYEMGYDVNGLDKETIHYDKLIAYSEVDYHDYNGFNMEKIKTSYQELDLTGGQDHNRPVETELVYGLHDGNTSPNDWENTYLIQEKIRLAETGNDNIDWAVTYYEYNHKTCEGDQDPNHTTPHWGDAYALTKKTDPCDSVTLYEYDDNHYRQWVKVMLDGNEVPVERYYHDEIGQMLLKADTYGLVTLYDYDGFGDVNSVRTYHDPNALDGTNPFTPAYYETLTPRSTTVYEYDHQRRRIAEKTFPEEKDPNQVAVKRTEYIPASNQPVRIIFDKDNDQNTTDSFVTYTYDGRGLKIEEENFDYDVATPRSWSKSYWYDSMNRLRRTDWYNYGDGSLLKRSISLYHGSDKEACKAIRSYDSGVLKTSRTDYKYDTSNRLKDVIVSYELDVNNLPEEYSITSYAYDGIGNRISITDPNDSIIYTNYDNSNRKTAEFFAAVSGTEPNQAVVRKQMRYYDNNLIRDVNTYDYNSVLLSRVEFSYDERGRLTDVNEAIDDVNYAVTVYHYEDANDSTFWIGDEKYANVIIVDPCDEQTSIAYSEQGKMIGTVYPSGQYQLLEYNGDGTLKGKTVFDVNDANTPHWIEYSYDSLGRLTDVNYPDGGSVNYSYDGFGRMIQFTDNRNPNDIIGGTSPDANKIIYGYDPLDRITDVNDQDGYHIKYSYRGDNQKQLITVTNPAQAEIYQAEYVYDAAGRLTDVKEPLLNQDPAHTYITQFEYDDNGNRKKIKYSLNGTTSNTADIDYTYNLDNLLTGFTTTGGPTFTLDNVTVDGLGRLTGADETITDTSSNTVAHSLAFAYDMRSQLTDANISNINGGNWVAEYFFKKNGDMASRIIQSDTGTFYYDGHQMTEAIGDENFTLTWDENGQLVTGASSESLVWNWDGKLRSAEKDDTTINLKYDPAGNRIAKDVNDGQTITARKYIVDVVGDLPVILLEIDDSNDVIKKTYVYANSQILTEHNGDYAASRYFYLHDRLGSVRQIIDTSGNVVKYYTYQPFGETLEAGGTFDDPFRFSGQFFDDEIGQYHLRARQYDPYIYRFTSRDPVFGKFKEPLTLHKYLYCQNEPINRIDPMGETYVDLNFMWSYGNFRGAWDATLSSGNPWASVGGFIAGGFTLTGGFMKQFHGGTYFYFGLGYTFSTLGGLNVSLTASAQDVEPGLNWGFTYTRNPLVTQFGYAGGKSFVEAGALLNSGGIGGLSAFQRAASATGYWVFSQDLFGDDNLSKAVIYGEVMNQINESDGFLGLQYRHLILGGLIDEDNPLFNQYEQYEQYLE